MGHTLSTIALGPVLYVQGRRVRRKVPRLPEAEGPRSGVEGQGPPVRVLVAGDSAAAGVGVPTQDRALVGRIVSALRGDFRVRWRLEAKTGDTTVDTLRRLAGLEATSFDVLATSLGVNDVTRGVPAATWIEDQRALLRLARERFGVSLFVVAGLPPMEGFPALPQPLRWYLGRRARELSRHLRSLVAAEPAAHFVDLRFTSDPSLMAEDGFHPGPEIYRRWGEGVAEVIREEWRPPRPGAPGARSSGG